MPKPMVFFNVGWMEKYRGEPQIHGGGKYVKINKFGHEVLNFEPHGNQLYGYVQPPGKGDVKKIRIKNLGAKEDDDSIDGVTVVWTAPNPEKGGTYIVGWYKKATVYKEWQQPNVKMNRIVDGKEIGYFVTAPEANAVLIPEEARYFKVPRRQKGYLGMSNIWYPKSGDYGVPEFVERVEKYIDTYGGPDEIIEDDAAEKIKHGPGGESEAHKTLKGHIYNNPESIGLDADKIVLKFLDNHSYCTGDRPDVIFYHGNDGAQIEGVTIVEIELDSEQGIMTGAHQLVKYRALACAELGWKLDDTKVKGVLVAKANHKCVDDFCQAYGIRFHCFAD